MEMIGCGPETDFRAFRGGRARDGSGLRVFSRK
jgi:hypothetical protein